MRTLNSIKNFKKEIEKQNILFLQQYSDIKKEVSKKIESEKKELLMDVANEYDLDFNELAEKYLSKKNKKVKKKSSSELNLIENSSDDEHAVNQEKRDRALSLDVDLHPLLVKGTANGKNCYYEDKEGGLVFDDQVKEIGTIKKGKIFLY
tara:strand:+ start:187 stop:636 length:450 start_codon:yes stop_codon:yes gene_type:complete